MTSSTITVRVAIAGAASLRGKELKQWLEEADFPATEIRLLDEELVAGTLTEAAGEPAVIETVDEDSFERVRFSFFTGSPKFSVLHGPEARRAGATVIDLSGGLAEDPDSRPWIPALDSVLSPPKGNVVPGQSQSLFLAPSAPADVAISLAAALGALGLGRLVLTFFQPVSERGREGVEELESQIVKLLSFEPIPQGVFDIQVGFNMASNYGGESGENLANVRAGYIAEVQQYLAGRVQMPAIALVQAPVFYSHAFTAYAEFETRPALEHVAARIRAAALKVASVSDGPPTNISVAGEPRPVLGQPERVPGIIENGIWLFGAADNLRVPVANAVSIAEKLLAS
jgi:aspartate-semialdehyde dehydrogenase